MFDQFEELLTLDPTDLQTKAEFVQHLGESLRNLGRWAMFAIRDDYLGALEPYRLAIPTYLEATYHLDLLRAELAKEAIEEPALKAGVTFEEGIVQDLLDELRKVQVQQPDGKFERKLGPYVEPVQLQVICQSLWKIKRDARVITRDHLAELGQGKATGGVDGVLASYYRDHVRAAAEVSHVSERLIRDWFGEQLIAAQGVRRTDPGA